MPHNQLLLPRHRRLLWTSRLIALVLMLIALAISEYLNRTELERLETFNRSAVLNHASTLRAALDTELNSTLYLASGLVGYVEVHRQLNKDETQRVLASIFRQGHHLRNIGLAPGNRLDFVYPIKGNEKAVGLYYPDLPAQWPEVKKAIDSHETVLAGPVELVQGGEALIARTPVYLSDGNYWGMISVVMDFNGLLEETGFRAERDGIRYALRGRDGKGANGAMILGDPALFNSNALITTLDVPGGEWLMAALPLGGWEQGSDYLVRYRIGGWLLALLLALLFYRTAHERLQVELLGLHDSLTGLPNRRLFEDRVEQILMSAARHNDQFALLYLDLDGFKPINDKYGHKIGDKVLVEVANRLKLHLRRTDTVARIGGDEFVMVLPRLLGVDEAMLVARKLVRAVAESMTVGGYTVSVGGSIGISIYPDNGTTAEELLKSADQAMYYVKEHGKGNVHYATPGAAQQQ
jgi:diguanylate cyclase (GGDEF)-like protein